ncbi:hypothetical protein AAC387_Pa05g2107 [Persea americana]
MENHAGSSSRRPHQAHEPGFDPNGWLTVGIGTQGGQAARQTHACLYCPRTFLSSQALQHWLWRERERREYAAIFPPIHASIFPPIHASIFPPIHAPIMPMFGPIVRVEPPTLFDLVLCLSAGPWGMNPVPANGYPGLLERRLELRGDEDDDLLRRIDMAETEDGGDDVTEVTETEDEDDVSEGGHETGDGNESEKDGVEVGSKELDLTLRL